MEASGRRGVDKWLPHMMEHEGVGKIISVGEGVVKVKPGDDVILGWIKGEGLDAKGPIYQYGGAEVNAAQSQHLATIIVAENRVYKKPEAMPSICRFIWMRYANWRRYRV